MPKNKCLQINSFIFYSNGGGRSGAFLAVDANLELLQRTGQLDVYEYGRTLANARQHLIVKMFNFYKKQPSSFQSSVEQYTFIYDGEQRGMKLS
jgi:protein tyrosine phosphatase